MVKLLAGAGVWAIGTFCVLLARMMLILAWNHLAGQQIFPLWDLPGALIGGILFGLVVYAALHKRPMRAEEELYVHR